MASTIHAPSGGGRDQVLNEGVTIKPELAKEGLSRGAERDESMSKVPRVTLAFWIIKILATTLGETGATPSP